MATELVKDSLAKLLQRTACPWKTLLPGLLASCLCLRLDLALQTMWVKHMVEHALATEGWRATLAAVTAEYGRAAGRTVRL